jgi:hypothetical protein
MPTIKHDHYTIERSNNVLIVDAKGPFNEDTAKSYHADITQLVEKMSGDPWGSLVVFRGSTVFTPEAERQLIETTRYRQKKGMIAIAIVMMSSTCAEIKQMQLQRIYGDCCITFHVFSDTDSAKAWLDHYIQEANKGSK